MSLIVNASETLFMLSATTVDGIFQPRRWTFRSQTKVGFNCGFYVPANVPPGKYTLTESDVDGSRPVSIDVTVAPDPYTVEFVTKTGDLARAVASAQKPTRFILPAGAEYVISTPLSLTGRVQIVCTPGAGASATITVKPSITAAQAAAKKWAELFALNTWSTSAQLLVSGLIFRGDTGGNLNSDGKTATGAIYCPMESVTAVACNFEGMDYGLQCDSTPTHQATRVLVESCKWPDLYAQGVWIGGREIDVDGCSGGPSRLEHPIRSSIVDLETNQLPQFVRIGFCDFDATHGSASSAEPGKESGAFRDGKYFYLQGNRFTGWAECGQDKVNGPWDYFGDYVFDGNTFLDPPNAKGTGTLNVRAGVNGPGIIRNNKVAAPMSIGAHVPPTIA